MVIRRYYLLGVVGVGKSTLLARLSADNPAIAVSTEWPDTMPADVAHAPDSLPAQRQEAIQDWIFTQVAKKNARLQQNPASVQLIDRSPLDTFAFYPREQWHRRARQLNAALAAQTPHCPLAPGALLFLHGNPHDIANRMDNQRNYTLDDIARQQSGFEALTAELEAGGNYVAHIDTCGKTPDEVAAIVQAVLREPYRPLNLQTFVDKYAHCAVAENSVGTPFDPQGRLVSETDSNPPQVTESCPYNHPSATPKALTDD